MVIISYACYRLLVDLFSSLSDAIPSEFTVDSIASRLGQSLHLGRIAKQPVYAPGNGLRLYIGQQAIFKVLDDADSLRRNDRLAGIPCL